MNHLAKTIQNSALAALSSQAPKGVLHAIKQASHRTGVNFAYLVQQASAESSFNPSAKAKTSSATGLYQFIESTWLSMVKKHGAKYGVNVGDKSRSELLEMRKDARMASFMAAEFAGENEKFLRTHWKGAKAGQDIGGTELYLAHFMGAGGAAAFLNARDENPMQHAAVLFPKAARANRNVFYDMRTGRARSLEEVHGFFKRKFKIENEMAPAKSLKTEIHVARPARKPSTTRVVDNSPTALAKTRPSYVSTYRKSHTPLPVHELIAAPVEVMLLAQLKAPASFRLSARDDTTSLFSRRRSYNE